MYRIKKSLSVGNIEYMKLDLNDLGSVKEFAREFNSKYDRLDILLNNAGIMALPQKEKTVQGIEKQIGVNHVGHFHLTNLLFDAIKASPEGRIINVSSMAHELSTKDIGGINIKDMNWVDSYDASHAYFQSKLANVYNTKLLAQKLEKEKIFNVKVVSLHPGIVRTELFRYMADNVCFLFFQKVLCMPM